MKQQFTVTFTNNSNETYDIIIQLHDNIPQSVKNTWLGKLSEHVNSKGGKVQTRHCAFKLPGRDAEYLADRLEKVIHKINTSFLNTEYGYEIEITEIPRDYPIEIHNIVHHHFELLIGQVWKHSHWYEKVIERKDWDVANAILQLNEISHELEEFLNEGIPPHFHTLFNFETDESSSNTHLGNTDLPPETIDIFTLGAKPGAVYIQYSQTGKTLTEVLEDDDEVIDLSNITSHRVTNGSFSICLGGIDHLPGRQEMLLNKYNTLIEKNNIQLDKQEMVLGRPEIGFVVTDNIEEVVEKMREHNTLYSITLNGKTKLLNTYGDRPLGNET